MAYAITLQEAIQMFYDTKGMIRHDDRDDYWERREQEGDLTIDELYVIEKHKIEALNLPCKEYDRAINELCDRIGY